MRRRHVGFAGMIAGLVVSLSGLGFITWQLPDPWGKGLVLFMGGIIIAIAGATHAE